MSERENVKRCERCGRRIGTKEANKRHRPHSEPNPEPVGRGSVRAAKRRRARSVAKGVRQAHAGQVTSAEKVLSKLGLPND